MRMAVVPLNSDCHSQQRPNVRENSSCWWQVELLTRGPYCLRTLESCYNYCIVIAHVYNILLDCRACTQPSVELVDCDVCIHAWCVHSTKFGLLLHAVNLQVCSSRVSRSSYTYSWPIWHVCFAFVFEFIISTERCRDKIWYTLLFST